MYTDTQAVPLLQEIGITNANGGQIFDQGPNLQRIESFFHVCHKFLIS